MSDFVNTKNVKVTLLLAATAALSVYCGDAEEIQQKDMLSAVLNLDMPRTVVAYVLFFTGAFAPVLVARMFKDRLDERTTNFALCGIVVLFSLIPFVKNWISGRQHAMYLSSLIVSLAPALSALSIVGAHFALSYSPYPELIFKVPPKPTGPKTEDLAANAIKAANDKLDVMFKDKSKKFTKEDAAEYLKVLKSVEASIVEASTATDRRKVYEYIINNFNDRQNTFDGFDAECKQMNELIAKVKKALKEIDQKELVAAFKSLKELELPKTANLKALKEAAEKYKFVEEHMPEEPKQDQQQLGGTTSRSSKSLMKEDDYEEDKAFQMASAGGEFVPKESELKAPSKEEIAKIEKEKQASQKSGKGPVSMSSVSAKGGAAAAATTKAPEKTTVTYAECKELLAAKGEMLVKYISQHYSDFEKIKETELEDMHYVVDVLRNPMEELHSYDLYKAICDRYKALKEKQEKEKAEKGKKDNLEGKKKDDEKSQKRQDKDKKEEDDEEEDSEDEGDDKHKKEGKKEEEGGDKDKKKGKLQVKKK